jgi:hypothetical protein
MTERPARRPRRWTAGTNLEWTDPIPVGVLDSVGARSKTSEKDEMVRPPRHVDYNVGKFVTKTTAGSTYGDSHNQFPL